MKTVGLIGFSQSAMQTHQRLLHYIFGCKIQVTTLLIGENPRLSGMDVVLAAAPELAEFLRGFLPEGVPILLMDYTIPLSLFGRIQKMEGEGGFSLVSNAYKFAVTRAILLERLGIRRSSIEIWDAGMGREKLHQNLVVFGETEADLGKRSHPPLIIRKRILALSTIIELAVFLEMTEIVDSPHFLRYSQKVCKGYCQFSFDASISTFFAADQLELTEGRMLLSGSLEICYADPFCLRMLGKEFSRLAGEKIGTVIPAFQKYGDGIHRFGEQVCLINGENYIVRVNVVYQHDIPAVLIRFSRYRENEQRQRRLNRQMHRKAREAKYTFGDIVGNSQIIRQCRQMAAQMAVSEENVLITGPTGVGKELFAQAIHNASSRKEEPFIALNCGAIVEGLLESELFGYEKGAFTGAVREGKPGVFEMADKGTLFLDEISEIPLHLQVKFLRVLQEAEVVRVGGGEVIPVDVRVIAAANRDLSQMARSGAFRSDLFYRINVLNLSIPPLSQRPEDVTCLMEYWKEKLGFGYLLTEEANREILRYPFYGNVRELVNCVKYLGASGRIRIGAEDLPAYIRAEQKKEEAQKPSPKPLPYMEARSLRILLEVCEFNRLGFGAGRRTLKERLKEDHFSENEIRKRIALLSEENLVMVLKGRAGVWLTQEGTDFLNEERDG